MDAQATTPDLLLTLDLPDPAIAGLSVLATLRVANHGLRPVTISARLNLMEGDLRLTVGGPDGAARVIQGWQADTALRQVTLEPGQELVGSINLLQTEIGPAFPSPGRYNLRAEFSPSPRLGLVSTPEVNVTVRTPTTDAERGVAELLQNEAVRRAIVMAQVDSAPEELRRLVTEFSQTLDGKLAQLILAGNSETAASSTVIMPFEADDPLSLALLILALKTPYSGVGKHLAEAFAAVLAEQAEKHSAATQSIIDKTLLIARGQPINTS